MGIPDGYTAIQAGPEGCLAFLQAALWVAQGFWMEQAGFQHVGELRRETRGSGSS